MTKHTIELNSPIFQRSFLEMMILEELMNEYSTEAIDTLATRGETSFPESPIFPAMRAYPFLREGDFDRAKQQLDVARSVGEHYVIDCLDGLLSEEAGFTFEAEQHFLRAQARHPDVPMTQRALAFHYFNRKFYGEAGVHLMAYIRLVGFNEETVPLLLEFFQVYDDMSLEMNDELMKAAIGYLVAHPHDSHAHSLYASICSTRFALLTADLEEGEPLTDEMAIMFIQVEDHGMWSATYDKSEERHFRAMFRDYVQDVVLPNTSRLYVMRLHLRYWTRRLTHRFTGGYSTRLFQ